MLRVGLTGELGSGKSTVACLLGQHGCILLSSDEIGRAMMQPGLPVYLDIVDRFGPSILLPDGQLNRPELARLAFDPKNSRIEELNAIVHPAVIAEQERLLVDIDQTLPAAIVIIESALIFTTQHAGTDDPWRNRFDVIVLVTAPDAQKIDRFIARAQAGTDFASLDKEHLRQDALQRLAAQRVPPDALRHSIQLQNDGDLQELAQRVNALYAILQRKASGQHA